MKIIENNIEYTVEELSNGTKFWWFNNHLHRINGPAVEHFNGYKHWFLNGIEYTKKEYYRELYKRGLISKREAFIELI